jgi:hypothetical protein
MTKKILVGMLASFLTAVSVSAQTVSSSILGTVTDPAKAAIASVTVQLTDQATGAVRNAQTDPSGIFRFPNVPPSTYTVTIRATGFKAHIEKDIILSSSETRDLGTIALEIGSVVEEVAVTAAATPIQLASSEKAQLIDANQLKSVALKGRDLFGYMQLLPGVIDTANRDVTSPNGLGNITINGNTSAKNFTVDGITDVDTGSNGTIHYEPNMDAVQEIRVLTSNYQAEFGRNSGGTITVVTKSGTQEFHGTGWWNHRHEQFNANNFFNNRSGLPRTPYRFNVEGWSLGGPAYIPNLFNTNRKRLFFFASQEYTRQFVPATVQYVTVPTQLERNGDFSQSYDGKGNLIRLTDPLSNAPFPGNIIPQSRIDPIGQKMLQFFPKPNFPYGQPGSGNSLAYQYNFQDAGSSPHPRRNDVVRADVYATSKLNAYFRWINDADDQVTLYNGVQWKSCCVVDHPNPGHGYAASATYMITPSTVNEFTFGKSFNTWSWYTMDEKGIDRSLVGNPPLLFSHQFAPAAQHNAEHNFIPNATFGSTPPNTASFGTGNAEYYNANDIWTLQDNLSKIVGPHNLKAGIYWEKNWKLQPGNANYKGVFSFAPDTNNPLNTGDGFANALLGNFTTYSENSQRTVFKVLYYNVEFYVQDNWRVNRKLTLDFGIRFYHQTPQVDTNKTFALFDPAAYSKTAMPRLYVPGFDANGKRAAMDPVTKATAPAAAIGLFVPGTGNPAAGMKIPGKDGVPAEPYTQSAIAPAPRFGFAYDVFGNGKTAIRGGFGIFYNRLDGNRVYQMSGIPPVAYTPTVYYSTIASLASGGGLLGPSNIGFFGGRVPWDRVQNASFGVQQALGGSIVLDVAYVGNWGYNQILDVNLNPVPLGANFDPLNADPTQPTRPLPTNFLRPKYPGYGDITQRQFLGHTNYNALQVSLNRRFSKGLMFGVAYTWSHSLGTTTFDPLVPNNEARNYGPTGADRRHNLAINYVYDLPNPGQKLNSKFLGILTDHWTLSGITSFMTGAPITPTWSSSVGADITGSASETPRLLVIGDAKTPTAPDTRFNTAAFAQPPRGNIGNLGVGALTGPGINNWDATLSKRIPIGLGEQRGFRIQIQGYNIFNHTQFSSYNIATSFNAAGVNTNTDFGKPSAARPARIVAFALRFEF